MSLRSLLTWCCLVVVLVLTGCSPSRKAKSAAEVAFEARQIPVVFYVLQGPGEPNATTDEDIWNAITLANQVYSEAQISFYVHAIARPQMQYLHRNEDGDERLPWSAVARDALTLAPAMAARGYDDRYLATRTVWLGQIASQLPPDGITVIVAPFMGHNGRRIGSNCVSPFPHNDGAPYYDPGPEPAWSRNGSRGVYCSPVVHLAGHRIDSLAHEFGHYLGGLYHAWELPREVDNGIGAADYYDLQYAIAPDGSLVRMQSREQALQAGAAARSLDGNCKDCPGALSRRMIPQSACVVEVQVPNGRGQMLVMNSAQHGPLVSGLLFPPLPGDWRHGINVMSYIQEDLYKTPCAFRLSPAQIRIVQKRIQEPRGQRNQLGSVKRSRLEPPSLPSLIPPVPAWLTPVAR